LKEIKNKWLLFSIIAAVGFFLDWLTKYLVELKLPYGTPVDIVGKYLQFLFVYNKGAVFGINPANIIPGFPVNGFFIVFMIIAIAVLVFYYRSVPKSEVVLHWGLALIMPGALGNLFDRIVRAEKGVVDFIRVGISEEIYWPIFNLADAYVTIGVGFLLLAFIVEEKRRKEAVAGANPSVEQKESGSAVNG
jgi:signal peptidase II